MNSWCRWTMVALLGAVCGCFGPVLGERGQLGFDYRSDDHFLFFSPDVNDAFGVDTRVEVTVINPTKQVARTRDGLGRVLQVRVDGEPVPVEYARSVDPTVFRVVSVSGHEVTLEGLGEGSADLLVRSAGRSDRIRLHVRRVARVRLAHSLTVSEAEPDWSTAPAFLRGGTVRLRAILYSGQVSLVGHGKAGFVTVEPVAAATLSDGPGRLQTLDVRFEQEGPVTLTPVGSPPLRLDVVSPAELGRVTLDPCALFPKKGDVRKKDEASGGALCERQGTPRVEAGKGAGLLIAAQLVDGRPVLGIGSLTEVRSLTPGVCQVDPADMEWLQRTFGFHIAVVRAERVGACRVLASVAGHTATVQLDVVASGPKAN